MKKCDTDRMADRERGILRQRDAERHFDRERRSPPDDLAAYVAYRWILTWDLRGRDPHRQQVLTHP